MSQLPTTSLLLLSLVTILQPQLSLGDSPLNCSTTNCYCSAGCIVSMPCRQTRTGVAICTPCPDGFFMPKSSANEECYKCDLASKLPTGVCGRCDKALGIIHYTCPTQLPTPQPHPLPTNASSPSPSTPAPTTASSPLPSTPTPSTPPHVLTSSQTQPPPTLTSPPANASNASSMSPRQPSTTSPPYVSAGGDLSPAITGILSAVGVIGLLVALFLAHRLLARHRRRQEMKDFVSRTLGDFLQRCKSREEVRLQNTNVWELMKLLDGDKLLSGWAASCYRCPLHGEHSNHVLSDHDGLMRVCSCMISSNALRRNRVPAGRTRCVEDLSVLEAMLLALHLDSPRDEHERPWQVIGEIYRDAVMSCCALHEIDVRGTKRPPQSTQSPTFELLLWLATHPCRYCVSKLGHGLIAKGFADAARCLDFPEDELPGPSVDVPSSNDSVPVLEPADFPPLPPRSAVGRWADCYTSDEAEQQRPVQEGGGSFINSISNHLSSIVLPGQRPQRSHHVRYAASTRRPLWNRNRRSNGSSPERAALLHGQESEPTSPEPVDFARRDSNTSLQSHEPPLDVDIGLSHVFPAPVVTDVVPNMMQSSDPGARAPPCVITDHERMCGVGDDRTVLGRSSRRAAPGDDEHRTSDVAWRPPAQDADAILATVTIRPEQLFGSDVTKEMQTSGNHFHNDNRLRQQHGRRHQQQPRSSNLGDGEPGVQPQSHRPTVKLLCSPPQQIPLPTNGTDVNRIKLKDDDGPSYLPGPLTDQSNWLMQHKDNAISDSPETRLDKLDIRRRGHRELLQQIDRIIDTGGGFSRDSIIGTEEWRSRGVVCRSSTPASSTPASSTPASSAPASSVDASTVASANTTAGNSTGAATADAVSLAADAGGATATPMFGPMSKVCTIATDSTTGNRSMTSSADFAATALVAALSVVASPTGKKKKEKKKEEEEDEEEDEEIEDEATFDPRRVRRSTADPLARNLVERERRESAMANEDDVIDS